jgi:putative membrane protein
MYRYGGGYPYAMGGFGLEWIFMLIFWVLIIWAILALIRMLVGKDQHWHLRGGDDEALRILKGRYAKGEIDKEEFEQKKQDLLN